MSKGAMDKRNLEAEIDRLALAAKALKLAVEQANWLLWTDRERAERILMQALKRPTMSALTKWEAPNVGAAHRVDRGGCER
jgi:hypothetical protein